MKLVIVSNNMHIGGVQKALVDMLCCIGEKADITLMLFCDKGEYMKDLPPCVKVQKVTSWYKYLGMTKNDVHTKKDKLFRAFFAAITRAFGRKYATLLMSLSQKKISGFDVAVSYLHNPSEKLFLGGCNDFVLKHIDAKKKITFLHCDYAKIGANTKKNRKQYAKFDVIAACSDGCRKAFLSQNPAFESKTAVVTNFHRFDKIYEFAATALVLMDENKINILTVARLGKEKGVLRALKALSDISNENFHYYIVGDGIERKEIEKYIKENPLSEKVTLCGELSNPYGYMKSADLLLIPSYSEAAPVVIDEAASLGTPIASTRTSSADEMITDRNLGFVCENSTEAIKNMLTEILSSCDKIKQKKESVSTLEFDNKTALSQLERVLGI